MEIIIFFENVTEDVSMERITTVFQSMDENGDECLDFAEFKVGLSDDLSRILYPSFSRICFTRWQWPGGRRNQTLTSQVTSNLVHHDIYSEHIYMKNMYTYTIHLLSFRKYLLTILCFYKIPVLYFKNIFSSEINLGFCFMFNIYQLNRINWL